MQAIDRMMTIVNVFVFTDPNRYLSITELSKECGLPLSSLHRILKSMEKHRMIKRDPEKKLYTLGTMWYEYGLRVYDTMDYVSMIRPGLEKLMRTVNASVYLYKPLESESMIIERIDCINQTIRAYDKLGLRTPFHKGIANLSMIAHMTIKQKENLSSPINLKNDSVFDQQLHEVREQGYAIGEDEWSKGITTIAAPIKSTNQEVVGAISIKLEGTNLPEKKLTTSVNEIIDISNRVSWRIGSHY